MCHIVYSSNKRFFISYGEFLVGAKLLNFPQTERPYFVPDEKYQIELSDLGIVFKSEPKEQECRYSIPIIDLRVESNLILEKTIRAGMHIDTITGYSFYQRDKIIKVPVAFETADVIFFDGDVVSVKKFILFNPSYMKNLFAGYDTIEQYKRIKIYFQGGYENWLLKYEIDYNTIIKHLNERNIL